MMKLFLVILSCLSFISGLTQIINDGRGADLNMQARSLFQIDVNGKPFVNFGGEDITEGSPFFSDKWMKASAVFQDGKKSAPFKGRINILKGEVHYLNNRGEEYITTSPITELFLTDTLTGTNYHFASFGNKNDNKPKIEWQQVLIVDSIILYKVIEKSVTESKGNYGSTLSRKEIVTSERYMVQQGNRAAVVKKPKDLLPIFPNQKPALSSFINTHPGSGYLNTDQQFIELVKYLNSILK